MRTTVTVVAALLISLALVGGLVAAHSHDTGVPGLFSAQCPFSELAHHGAVLPVVELGIARLDRLVEGPPEGSANQVSAKVRSLASPRAPPVS